MQRSRVVYMRFLLFLLISTLSLTACTAFSSKPEKALSFAIDKNWKIDKVGQGKISSPLSLIEALKSPELLTLYRHSEASNFDLKIVAAQVNAAAASANIDSSQLWPKLNANLQGSRTESDLVFRPESYSLDGTLSWELDLWGRIRNRKKASKLTLEAAIANYEAARLSFAGNLAIAWFNFIDSFHQHTLAKQSVELSGITLKSTQKRYRRGLVPSLEVSQALSSKARSDADLAERKRATLSSLQSLNRILGPSHNDENIKKILARININDQLLPESQTLPEVPGNLPIDVVRSRPDIISSERNYKAAVQLWRAAGKQSLPSLSLSASAGFNSLLFENLTDSNNKTNSVSGQLTAPLFYFGEIKNRTAQAGAQAEEQFQAYNKVVFEALLEIQQNLDSDELISHQLIAQSQALDESKRLLDITERDYRNGLVAASTLINAEQNFINAKRSFISLNTQRLQQRVQLLLAMGGSVPNITNTLISSE